MSIMKRMRDITVASLNELLENSEDPLRLIDQFLYEQRQQIDQNERLYQQVIRHAATVRRQYLQEQELADKRERQVMVALKADEELVARMALQEKLQHEEQASRYKELYEQSQMQVIELENRLEELKSDYQEVLSKRQYYATRMESLRLQQRMNDRRNFSRNFADGRAFQRLDERISDMEIDARALREVRGWAGEQILKAGAKAQESLDKEMKRLREKIDKEGWMKDE